MDGHREHQQNVVDAEQQRVRLLDEENTLLRAALRDCGVQLAQMTAQRESLATSAGAAHQRFVQLEHVARIAVKRGSVAVLSHYLDLVVVVGAAEGAPLAEVV